MSPNKMGPSGPSKVTRKTWEQQGRRVLRDRGEPRREALECGPVKPFRSVCLDFAL